MVKMENANFPLPDVPPGFDPLPPQIRPTAVESSKSQNPTPTEKNGHRRPQRKRVRPEFYEPPTRRRTAPSARPQRGQPAAPPLRRGRPPKARSMSLFSLQEAQRRDANGVSSTPLTRPQEQGQGQMPYCIKPVQLTKEQISSQAKNQGGPEPTTNGKIVDITIDKNEARSINQSTFSQARDSEETAAVDTRSERSKNVGRQNKMTEGIDPVILQHVANALEYKNVYSRSSDFDKNLVHTLKAIEKKHGDITKDCLLESDCMKTLVMVGVCKVVQDLQKKRLMDLDVGSLGSYYTAVRDAENMKVNVQWLHDRLDEIKDVVDFSSEAKGMESERVKRLVTIDRKKRELVRRRMELERIKSEVRDIEEQIAQEAVMVDELDRKYCDHMSRMSQFQQMNLMDGLLEFLINYYGANDLIGNWCCYLIKV